MNQYDFPSSPSQLGLRPAAVLSTAFLTQAFLWMFLGLLVTTGVGWWVSTLPETTLLKLSGLFLPVIILQLGIALGLGFAIRSIPATLGLGLFFVFSVRTAYDVQRSQRGDVAAWAGTMEKGAVMGAFRLYLDFINLFFALLRIFGGSRR